MGQYLLVGEHASFLPTHRMIMLVLSNTSLNLSRLLILTGLPLFSASYRLGYFCCWACLIRVKFASLRSSAGVTFTEYSLFLNFTV